MSTNPRQTAGGPESASVAHRPDIGRFEIVMEDGTAVLDYSV